MALVQPFVTIEATFLPHPELASIVTCSSSSFSFADLRTEARAIWQAGVDAVDSARLVQSAVSCTATELTIAGTVFPLANLGRILVIGGGKAGAGMAAGLEAALQTSPVFDRIFGLLNVPADCVRPLARIELRAGRPAGVNEPTMEGVAGVTAMLDLVRTLQPEDLCLILLSGGGSALLPAPVEGISLADKQAVTRSLMLGGAPIEHLNALRGALSRVKAGGLARALPAGRALALVISDVIDDPLGVIASGPAWTDAPAVGSLVDLLARYVPVRSQVPDSVWQQLTTVDASSVRQQPSRVHVRHVIIGNNATALEAARQTALARGWTIASSETNRRGIARELGVELAERCDELRHTPVDGRGWCLLSGGEPTVQLAPFAGPRRGGRNQELALAALQHWKDDDLTGLVLLSGGTDGEDGPTDAAGAVIDAKVQQAARVQGLSPEPFLAINNAYPFLEATGGLIKTGPTHTNVMDIRVALVVPSA